MRTLTMSLGGMNKILAYNLFNILTVIAIQASAQTTHTQQYSLDSVQGSWWSNCDNPAVEFLIIGDEYSGDFAGSYKLKLTGDILVFNDGLTDGHSINVTHDPLLFRILTATETQLVLRPLPGNPYIGDWHLQSCNDIQPGD